MQEFERATFHKENSESTENGASGKFVFEPLERGFGTTIGNAICQTMLNNLPGTGAVGFQIAGVNPQDTMAPGVEEDLVSIGLNVRALQLSTEEDGLQKLTISRDGPAVITAADIVAPEEVEILDPDQVILTLNAGEHLDMDIFAAAGTGYKNAAENREEFRLEPDVIALDTVYTPIREASYLSEPARVGQNIKYDKVTFDVTTNGTISPLQAISQASRILVGDLDEIVPLAGLSLEEIFTVQQPAPAETVKPNAMMIEDLDLSVRSYNCLKRVGIQSVDELTQKTEEEMSHVKNLGKKSLKEVKERLEQLGLSFKTFE